MGIMDDVLKNLNQGISEIQNKTQEAMNSLSISSRINSLEAKKNALFINIGQLIYDKYEKGDEVSEDLLKDKAKEITAIEKEIDTARGELKSMKLEPDAPRAEKAAHQAGYKPTPGFHCPHCGAPANSSKFFCVSCGGSLKEGTCGQTSSTSDGAAAAPQPSPSPSVGESSAAP